ncbi:ABC transporter permease [Cellvibrio zantedeschiae]|uniref:ABC transporter permease n=1 Tax=Cellvibrio zantedeschiae TaxID=1237077 RepID=A0ABQ3B4V4_9GAMM|nr:FtsX-like permease family protein [Cellvibrio zantedeschiae]GGY79959.1 ABC transporter permease [Cellvibrio zantedeschiae]
MSFKLLFKSLLRRKLVVALLLIQLAVTLALIVNSILLALHARELVNRETGLDLENTLMVSLKPTSPALGKEPALSDLMERQLAALRALPGVEAAAYANQAPLVQGGSNSTVEDLDDPQHVRIDVVPVSVASVDIIKALNLKLIEGQLPDALDPLIDFSVVDIKTLDISTRGAVVTESVAKRLYGDQSAIGRVTTNGRIVAVVSDFTSQLSMENVNYQLFNIDHMYPGAVSYILFVRTQAGMADKVKSQLADTLRAADSNIDIFFVRSLAEQRDELYSRQSGLAVLLTTLGALMLLVAMVSAYSNAFFHALKQRQEIGMKRAIGASQNLILRELFSEAWLTTGIGCVLGVFASLGLNKLLASVLTIPEVPFWLPSITVGMMIVCVTLATWYPAKVATNISPASAAKSL